MSNSRLRSRKSTAPLRPQDSRAKVTLSTFPRLPLRWVKSRSHDTRHHSDYSIAPSPSREVLQVQVLFLAGQHTVSPTYASLNISATYNTAEVHFAHLFSASRQLSDIESLPLSYKGRERTPIGPDEHSDVAGGVETANISTSCYTLLTWTLPFCPFICKKCYLDREVKYTIRKKIRPEYLNAESTILSSFSQVFPSIQLIFLFKHPRDLKFQYQSN